ncbi:hypothetical protein MF621_004160 (plasmid) [Bacillus velezensis]|uniref:hypothetical protein n=1 Tax=Bacillus TaxID=1386 RepID=UPI0004A1410D|nr:MULTISPECIES: hypothetical protein [Bacillus amyloliquefaciens group]KDN91401.1 hypothetical protein EF87_18715 [Bacillus amyloliquefaciens]MED2914215.1 hypothetical protein [Bacillus velezensis]UFD97690.1 hypothetical protein [Bacillus amyloliquefaciens]URJ76537.1 hypothetical protein MF619_004179 [Bacillus velezensis]URJ80543.1 hypothetical protein MF621_004160 [Bacillus velezensis]
MVDNIIHMIVYIVRAIQLAAGAFAAYKLALYAIGYMTKNPQKVEEAKGGMKNVVVGLFVVGGCEGIVKWIQQGAGF